MITAHTLKGPIKFTFRQEPNAVVAIDRGRWGKGMTTCFLSFNNTEVSAEAVCSPEDHFNREIGRKISLTRALEASGLAKKERREVWEAYHARG